MIGALLLVEIVYTVHNILHSESRNHVMVRPIILYFPCYSRFTVSESKTMRTFERVRLTR